MKFCNIILSTLAVSGLANAAGKTEIFRTCKQPNTIAFTIDDGPTEHTPELLAALKSANITATFFINGANTLKDQNGEPMPQVIPFIKDIYAAGHEIGSHTYNHACFTTECMTNNPYSKNMGISKEAFTEQIIKNENLIYEAIGKYPASYRAPFGDGQNPGAVNETLSEWLYELGYPYSIHWDIETQDMEFQTNPDVALAKAQEHYNSEVGQHNTLITLQHAIPVTVEKIIPWVKNVWMPAHPNMRFVTVSECLGLPADAIYKTVPGPVEVKGKATSGAVTTKASIALIFTTLLTVFYLL